MDLPPPPNPSSLPAEQSSSFNSIFGSKPPIPSGASQDTINQINSMGRRVRMMEEAVMNVRRKIEIQEEDALKTNKSQSGDIRALFSEIDDVKHELKSFKDDMVKIISELQGMAKKEELATVQRYIEIWQPIKFVTQNEVQKIVEHVIDMRLSDKRIVDDLINGKINRASVESAPTNPEHMIDMDSEPLVETIREKVRDAKKLQEDEEPQIPARPTPISKPKENTNTDAYPASILHALASNIEQQRKTVSESHIHPSDPQTDIQDVDDKDSREQKEKEIEKYKTRIDEVMRRKKELHDLLGK